MLIPSKNCPERTRAHRAGCSGDAWEASGHPVTVLTLLDTDPFTGAPVDLLHSGDDPILRSGGAITDTMITAAIRADLAATVLHPGWPKTLPLL